MLRALLIAALTILLGGCASARQIGAEAEIVTPAGSSLETVAAQSEEAPQNFQRDDVVLYLPFPANLGVIKNENNGEQLETFILAPAITSGSRIDITPLALISLTDSGREVRMLLTIPADPSLQVIKSPTLEQLESNYPGVTDILTIWLSNRKGSGLVTVNSIDDEREAARYLEQFLDR